MKEKKPINVITGQNVKWVREHGGLTQERFAEILDFGTKHISSIERGITGLSLTSLKRICVLMSVSADTLLFGIPDHNENEERETELRFLMERLSRLPDHQFRVVKEMLDKLLLAITMQQQSD